MPSSPPDDVHRDPTSSQFGYLLDESTDDVVSRIIPLARMSAIECEKDEGEDGD
jgi:hypothetical protein